MGVKLSGAYADTKSGPPLYADSSRETSSEDPAIALRSGYSTTTPHLLPGSRIGPCHFPQHAQCPARIIAEERVPIPRKEYEAPDVPYVAERLHGRRRDVNQRYAPRRRKASCERGDHQSPRMRRRHFP